LDLATLLKEKCFVVVIRFEGPNVECGKNCKRCNNWRKNNVWFWNEWTI